MKYDIPTKNEIEKLLKESERKLSKKINQEINTRLNEAKKEESKIEKELLKKKAKKDEKEWSMVKNKEERLLALEQQIESLSQYLHEEVTKMINGLAEAFNKHVDKNNDDFQTITNALRGGKKENEN